MSATRLEVRKDADGEDQRELPNYITVGNDVVGDRLWRVLGDEPALVDVQTGLDGRFVRLRKVEAGSHDLHDPGGEGMRGADICSGRRWSVSRSSG